jgi:alpha-tubulin suppressor-like RCC1 family protein
MGSPQIGYCILILLVTTGHLLCAELASHPTASTSFVIDENGILYGWGRNDLGQVGNGTLSVEPPGIGMPFGILPPAGANGWKRVSAAWSHTLAITDNDQLYAWGFNGAGRLGTGRLTNETAPAPVALPPGVSGWLDVAAGGGHSLAIGSDGRIYAWGANDWGQLAIGPPSSGGTDIPVAAELPAEAGKWKAVAAGNAHSLALSQIGELYFWGRSISYQGEGVTFSAKAPTWIPAPQGSYRWRKIAAGYNHSFAIADNGKLYAWGARDDGQLGTGSPYIGGNTPLAVVNPGTNAVEIFMYGVAFRWVITGGLLFPNHAKWIRSFALWGGRTAVPVTTITSRSRATAGLSLGA